MAPCAHISDRFAPNADVSTDRNKANQADHSIVDADDNKSGKANDFVNPTEFIENTAPLHVHVERAVRDYFAALGDELPTDLYELILMQVELPLLTVVLEQARGNQTKCAQILGLNRGTLRKKLKTYDLMS